MEFFDKKITPKDVFVTALNAEELNNYVGTEAAELVKRNKPSGNEFIDALAQLINANMIHSVYFYEKKMGVNAGGIFRFCLLYSGMTFKEWSNEYLLLAAKELLLETDCKLEVVGRRIGFSGISAFSQWFICLNKEAPSVWRRNAKRQRDKEDAELFLKFKRELRAGKLIDNN